MLEKPQKGYIYDGDERYTDETTTLLTSSSQLAPYGEVLSQPRKNPFYLPSLEYSPEEENEVLRIIDARLMPCILLTTFVLNMDRTNNSNAISDNLPFDLGFDINVVNTATALHSIFFAIACLTGAVIAKIVGPHKCAYFHWLCFSVCPDGNRKKGYLP